MSVQRCCYSAGFDLSNDCFAPEERVRRQLGQQYKDHPIGARVVAVPLAAVLGVVKPLVFPVWSLVLVVALPLIAAGRSCVNKDPLPCLQAWTFALLGLIGSLSFLVISAYYLPLIASAGIFIAGMSFSIIVHVHRAIKAPFLKPSPPQVLIVEE